MTLAVLDWTCALLSDSVAGASLAISISEGGPVLDGDVYGEVSIQFSILSSRTSRSSLTFLRSGG